MNISKINELLQENEKIKSKIIEIKRKLNLRNYNKEQKAEFSKIINMLEDVLLDNQYEISTLSTIKASEFARIVCKVLNRQRKGYEVKNAWLNFPKNSNISTISKYFKNEDKGLFLVVTNKKPNTRDVVSLDDINQIPIAFSPTQINYNGVDDHTDILFEYQHINLFKNQDLITSLEYESDVKTFDLDVDKNEKMNNKILELKLLVKNELGIWCKEKSNNLEKQQ